MIITGLNSLTEDKQQEIGQSILVAMFRANIPVDGVKVEFEYENEP